MKETTYHIAGAPRMALLTDLHGQPYQEALRAVTALHPEIIAIAGDIIYGSLPAGDRSPLESQKLVLPFLRACVETVPTYLSLGNHEQCLDQRDLDAIRNTGVMVLDNNWVEWNGIVIGGLTSGYVMGYRKYRGKTETGQRYPKPEHSLPHDPDTSWLRAFAATPGFHILLSHHPEYYPMVPAGVELVVSGHSHGGQWNYYSFNLKRWCGIFAPGQGLFPKYTSGVYDGRLVVSRGLANTAKVLRILNPTEAVFIQSDGEI